MSLHEQWDALTAEALVERGGLKWTQTDARGRPALGAWVAEMDFGTAPPVLEALRAVTERGDFGYASEALHERMGEAAADWMAHRYGWRPEPAHVHPLADVIQGMVLAITEFSRPGAPVIVPTPAYMPFLDVPPSLGRQVLQLPLLRDADGGFAMDLDALDGAFAAGADVLVLANPGNPTGKVFRREELVAIAEVAARHDARVFADEIHAPLTLHGLRHVPYASVSPEAARTAVTAMSASKAWNLPGLKTAQLVLTNARDRARWASIGFMASHGASTPGLHANIAAYAAGEPWLNEVTSYLEGNERLLREGLAAALPDARLAPLEGTYLAWVDLSAYAAPGEPAERLLEAGVAVNAGPAFGLAGAGHVRVNLATGRGLIAQIVERMGALAR